MTAVMVFVDDALTGRFPEVCAKTGRASNGWLTLTAEVRKRRATGWLWGIGIVLLAIPVLWYFLAVYLAVLGLISIVMAVVGDEALTVQLPWTEDAHQETVASLGKQRTATAVAVAGLIIGPLAFQLTGRWFLGGILIVAGIVAAALAVSWSRQRHYQQVVATLDASRRWVRLDGVHPGFVAAVLAQNSTASRPTSR